MHPTRWLRVTLSAAAVTCLLIAPSARADGDAKGGGMNMGSMMPKPGAEAAHLQKLVGHWTSHTVMTMEGMPQPMKWDGTQNVTSINGGLGIAFADMGSGAMTFEGHGMETWDSVKKKYVGAWMDNMGVGVYTWEGSASDDGKTFTDKMTGWGMTGEMETTTMVNTITDANHRSMNFYKGTDTSAAPMMVADYTRATMTSGHKRMKK